MHNICSIFSQSRVFFASLSSPAIAAFWFKYSAVYLRLSNYVVVGLTIERFIALCLPLKAHSLLTSRWTIFILLMLTIPFCIYFTALVPFSVLVYPAMQVHSYYNNANNDRYSESYNTHIWFKFHLNCHKYYPLLYSTSEFAISNNFFSEIIFL